MRYLAVALLFLTAAFPANAQQPVTVIGPITVGDCAQFSSVTIIKDAGVTCGGGGGGGGIVVGTTTVTGAGAGQFLFNNSGVVGAATLGTMSTQSAGAVAITGGTITGIGLPSVSSDVANKQYVDNSIVGLIIHSQALLATTAALPANTYNNGSSGVGATLTGNSFGALTVDGVVVAASNRIVVKNEAAAANNGIYTVTTVGDGSHDYVLTRATDANTPGVNNPTEIGFGTYVFVISGAANADTGWSVTSTVTTIGTSAINWAQFSVSGGGSAGNPGGANGQVQYNNSGAFGGLTNTQLTVRVNPVIPDAFCTVDRTGASDMGACINSAIAAAKSCNSTTATPGFGSVYLRAGIYLITTPIVPKSCMMIYGDGPGATVLLTNSNTPFGPPAGQQLVHFQLRDLTFKDSGSHASATVMAFPSLQDARLTNLGFSGYSSGTLASFSTSLVTSFDDTNAPWHDSNIIFNQYTNWQGDGCGICIIEAGHYGSTPTASPPNSSNVPDQVVTANHFENISLSGCATKCLDFIKATDTEFFTNVYAQLLNNAIAVQIGDDNANFPGNNYVNSMRIQITISGGATGTTFFQFGDWTLGNIIDVEHDYAVGTFTPVNIQTSVTLADYIICGKNLYTALAAFPIGNNGVCGSGGTYFRVGNGSFNIPIFGFGNDIDNGLYLVSAGAAAWSRNFRIDGHILSGSALGVPTLTSCGTASFNPLPSDTAGQILISGGPVTACTLTFGAAFANIPLCVFTPVGSQNPVFVSAESASAVTINFTSTSSQRFSYICLASPGG